jgi:hypothetical protein
MMKRTFLALAATLLGSSAFAADLPSRKAPVVVAPVSTDGFDFAFGLKVMSDYISRGVTQSDHQPSATVYFEPRYNIGDTQLYIGSQLWKTNLPTNPFGEVDLYGGVRQTWGDFSVDVGGIYYLYPGNRDQYWTSGAALPVFAPGTTLLNPGLSPLLCPGGAFCATTAADPSWFELYLKPSYNFTKEFNVALNFFYSPNWTNYNSGRFGLPGGGFSSYYLSVIPKYTFGETGFSVSGEFGRQWLGTLKPGTIYNAGPAGFKFPDYFAWNAGVSYNWNNVTFDLRYYGTDLSKAACYAVSSDPSGNRVGAAFTGKSTWCDNRIMASLAVDFTYGKDIKK